MGIGSGLGASLGWAAEPAYGTYTAPTRWYEFDKESLVYTPKRIDGKGLAAGVIVDRSSQRHTVSRDAGGTIDGMVMAKGMGLLLAHAMGSTAVPVQQAATAAYKQTHVLGDNRGQSLTIQKGVPDTGGTARPYNILGCKISSAKFSCAKDGLLMSSFGVDGRDVQETSPLVAPTYLTANPEFGFEQGVFQIGALGSEATKFVTGFDLTITRPLKVDRFGLDGTGMKQEPLMNGRVGIAGSIDTEFVDKAAFADMFANDTPQSLVISFTGPLIGGAFSYGITFRVPSVRWNGSGPSVDGPDVVNPKMSFKGFYDDVNAPASIEYTSTDVAA